MYVYIYVYIYIYTYYYIYNIMIILSSEDPSRRAPSKSRRSTRCYLTSCKGYAMTRGVMQPWHGCPVLFVRFPFYCFAVLSSRPFCSVSRFLFCRFSQRTVCRKLRSPFLRFGGHAKAYYKPGYYKPARSRRL